MSSNFDRFSVAVLGVVLAVAGGRAAVAQAFDSMALADRITSSAEQAPDAAASSANSAAQPPASVSGVLRSLASRASVVFVGEVESIKPNGGVMEIVFRVQQPVIGEVGSTYTLREWSGRWSGGQQHYRLGQRSMVFLYAPSAAGLSSPVDGMAGVVPLIPMGADTDPLLDVRMLATRVERSVGSPVADADFGSIALADALAVVAAWNRDPLPEPIKHPLPIGLRPNPVKTSMTGTDLPSLLQPQGASNVEY
jgi:hypothetical protein